jgi:hypothetical protein
MADFAVIRKDGCAATGHGSRHQQTHGESLQHPADESGKET